MGNKTFFHCCVLATALFLSPTTASAQFGGLGKLKNKAKEAVQKKVEDTKQDLKKETQQQADNVQKDAKKQAEFNTLNNDQKWALRQMVEMTEAPEMSGFFSMKDGEKTRFGSALSEQDKLMEIPFDTIQRHKRLADAGVEYATHILDIYKTLPKYHGYYVTEDEDRKVSASRNRFERWQEQYKAIEERTTAMLDMPMAEFKIIREGDVYHVSTAAILLPFCKGHPVQYDAKDKKFKFFVYKTNPTYIDEAEMKRQEQSLDFMRAAAALLNNPDPSKRNIMFYKLDLAEQVTRAAMANNSRDNITYRERPKGSAMNTSALKAEALKVLQKRFPGAGYEEAIITGEDWVEVRNIFGIVIERYIFVAGVFNGGIAKQLMHLSLGNNRTSSGWGPLQLYGVSGPGAYVK